MDLRRLEMLVAVVDHGSFTAAAEALHVAQPSVSLALKELEREVGTSLLVRSRRGVTPTPAGEALLGPARRALREVEQAADAVAAVRGITAGHLDVASLPTLAADPVAEMVGRFRRAHPGVTVRLAAPATPHDVAVAVRDGRAELGITETGRWNDGLVEHALGDQELVAVSPPGTEGGRGALALERLAGMPLVLTLPGTSIRTRVEEGLAAVDVTPTVAVETAQRDALVPLVLSGAGTTFVPAAVAATAAEQGAVVRHTTPRLRRTVVVVQRRGPASPAAARFLALRTG